MRTTRVRRLLGVEHTVVESVGLEPDGRGGEVFVAQVRPTAGVACRCSRCGRRPAGYDVEQRPRRWRVGGAKQHPWALLRNPVNHSGDQRTTVAGSARTKTPLYTVYLLKQQRRAIVETTGASGRALLTGWISWAQRARIPPLVTLAETTARYRALILNTLDHNLSNARVEATHTQLQLLTRRAYGYHTPDSFIAMVDLTRSGLCPPFPGRTA